MYREAEKQKDWRRKKSKRRQRQETKGQQRARVGSTSPSVSQQVTSHATASGYLLLLMNMCMLWDGSCQLMKECCLTSSFGENGIVLRTSVARHCSRSQLAPNHRDHSC